jgi:uncharacterized membrane protein
METRQEQFTDRWFVISVFLKGVISAFEMLVGILVLVIPPQAVIGFLIDMSEDALADNPDSFLAVHSLEALQHLPPLAQGFIAVYLFSRGFLKLLLVVALLRNQLWAYPAAIGVLGLFVCYQAYEVVKHHSPIVLLLSVFDLIVMWFIWREYRIVRAHPRHSAVEEVIDSGTAA